MSSITDYTIHGYDVSHHNSTPDFTDAHRQFAIVKATEGSTFTDSQLTVNRSKAHAQSLLAVGLYHFARPHSSTPIIQARHFLNKIGHYLPGEFAVLDFEDIWDESWAVDYLRFVQVEYPGPVVFYTYSSLLSANPHARIQATGADLWIARYSSIPPNTSWPWTLWQHTDGQSSVSGNDGTLDCSVFHSNDPTDLRKWVGTYPPPPPLPHPNPPTHPNPTPTIPVEVNEMDFFILSIEGDSAQYAWFPELGSSTARKGLKAIFHDGDDVTQARKSSRFQGDLTFTPSDVSGIPNLGA